GRARQVRDHGRADDHAVQGRQGSAEDHRAKAEGRLEEAHRSALGVAAKIVPRGKPPDNGSRGGAAFASPDRRSHDERAVTLDLDRPPALVDRHLGAPDEVYLSSKNVGVELALAGEDLEEDAGFA